KPIALLLVQVHNVLDPLLQMTFEIFGQDHAGKGIRPTVKLMIDEIRKKCWWHHSPAQTQASSHNFRECGEPDDISSRVHRQHRRWRLPLEAKVAVDVVLDNQHAIFHSSRQHLMRTLYRERHALVTVDVHRD